MDSVIFWPLLLDLPAASYHFISRVWVFVGSLENGKTSLDTNSCLVQIVSSKAELYCALGVPPYGI
jgi:hypothetical protein